MRLELVEPHPKYNNLDQCCFVCECGAVLQDLIARDRIGGYREGE